MRRKKEPLHDQTIEPYELMAKIHNRMPVVLAKSEYDLWPDTGFDTAKILKPCPSEWLEAYPMNKRVGNARKYDLVLIESLR